MLYLITGPNGGGKSLKSIELMHKLHAQGVQIFAFGYHDLKLDFVDETLDPRDWKLMPPGSAMFVDEAQKAWRARRGNREVPPELQEMEEHRYEGIDIYLITQDPSFLDNHIKGLVSKHWHCVPYGQDSSRVFEFNECQDNTKSIQKRANAEFKVWQHPKKYYGVYTSAKHHMQKPKIPWKHRIPRLSFIAAGVIAVLCICALVFDWGPDTKAKPAAVAEERAGSSLFGGVLGRKGAPMTEEQYLFNLQPRFPEIPWSAPAYDHRQVQSSPQVFCIEGGEGLDGNGEWKRTSVTCLTEQGTSYRLPPAQALNNARNGPAYNPFKPPASANPGRVEGEAPSTVDGRSAPAPVGVGLPGAEGQQAAYGAFRG